MKSKPLRAFRSGRDFSGMREHPTRPEVFGVSSARIYVWILDPRFDLRRHFTGRYRRASPWARCLPAHFFAGRQAHLHDRLPGTTHSSD